MATGGRAGRRVAGAAGLVCLLAGCVSPTPYQAAADGYGYGERRIEADRYRVVFFGNDATPRDSVETYTLYRAAQLTLEQGFDYFVVTDRDLERDTRYVGTVDDFGFGPFFPYDGYGRYGRFDAFGNTGFADLSPISAYSGVLNIRLFKGTKPGDDANAYDARAVARNLRRYIQPPNPGTADR